MMMGWKEQRNRPKDDHLINEHLIPLQWFTAGVVSSLSVLTGQDPVIPTESDSGEGRVPSPQPEQPQAEDCPPPVNLISLNLRAFGLDPTNYAYVSSPLSGVPSPVPNLQSLSSSSEESLLCPTTPLFSGIGGEYFHLSCSSLV